MRIVLVVLELELVRGPLRCPLWYSRGGMGVCLRLRKFLLGCWSLFRGGIVGGLWQLL